VNHHVGACVSQRFRLLRPVDADNEPEAAVTACLDTDDRGPTTAASADPRCRRGFDEDGGWASRARRVLPRRGRRPSRRELLDPAASSTAWQFR
jgi:hypothetical protein